MQLEPHPSQLLSLRERGVQVNAEQEEKLPGCRCSGFATAPLIHEKPAASKAGGGLAGRPGYPAKHRFHQNISGGVIDACVESRYSQGQIPDFGRYRQSAVV